MSQSTKLRLNSKFAPENFLFSVGSLNFQVSTDISPDSKIHPKFAKSPITCTLTEPINVIHTKYNHQLQPLIVIT
ncbi:unnamed protein product [Ambrosiozyma monospora]|uniref:Unnamed protein product n=1 Tax=Ambrosiozyma monospora TaxID=43982 RepID=A0ACB5TK13_AMBMO|nr:unnamed protein product [Ambrosiozyma monospora]